MAGPSRPKPVERIPRNSAALNPTAVAILLRCTPTERAAAITLAALSRPSGNPPESLHLSAGVRPGHRTPHRAVQSRMGEKANARATVCIRCHAAPRSRTTDEANEGYGW